MKAAKLRTKDDVTISDRISHLPDDLLIRILSLIPISDAMHTSVLSKRWKFVWKMMPNLEFHEESCPNIGSRGFEEFCKRSFQLHEAPVLKTLTIKLNQQKFLKLPSSFPNTFFQKMVVLKLHKISPYFDDSQPSTVCFLSLKSLHLTHVRFRGEEAFCRLISDCPVLENIFLNSVITSGFQFRSHSLFTISVPSLQRLEIKEKDTFPSYASRFTINTLSLKYLNLWIKDFIGRFELEDMPNLVEARLGVDPYQTCNFLRFLSSVQILSVHVCATKVLLLAEKISQRLLHLELYIYGKIPRNLLLHLLKHAPKLQFLKLREIEMTMTWPTYPHTLVRVREFNDPLPSIANPSSVPECVSLHLNTFQWGGYQGREEEKEIVLYILQNALCLKTAAISVFSPDGLENELLLIGELESMPKVSTSCQLVTRHRQDRCFRNQLLKNFLMNCYSEQKVYCMALCAYLCIRRDPNSRPRMSQVLQMLEGDVVMNPM